MRAGGRLVEAESRRRDTLRWHRSRRLVRPVRGPARIPGRARLPFLAQTPRIPRGRKRSRPTRPYPAPVHRFRARVCSGPVENGCRHAVRELDQDPDPVRGRIDRIPGSMPGPSPPSDPTHRPASGTARSRHSPSDGLFIFQPVGHRGIAREVSAAGKSAGIPGDPKCPTGAGFATACAQWRAREALGRPASPPTCARRGSSPQAGGDHVASLGAMQYCLAPSYVIRSHFQPPENP